MKSLQELEKDFRAMNSLLIEEYEDSVKEFKKEEKARNEAKGEELPREKILSAAGFDVKMLDKKDAERTKAFEQQMEVKRKEFIARKSNLFAETQEKSLYTGLMDKAGAKVLTPFGASIMAADQELVKNVEGERGNPWVFPTDPSQIKIKDYGHIGGWRCWQAYASAPPPVAYAWFYFVPDRSGLWNFSSIMAFHGFYILRSDDSWYNCRSAWVKLTASVRVYQYSWQAERNYTLLDKHVTNADYLKLYDSTEWLDSSAILRAGDGAWIRVKITVDAMSLGSGTWGELNFQDGSANYILPLLTVAW